MVYQNKTFNDLFKTCKPVLAMIHLKGDSREEKLKIAKHEIDLLLENDIDAVIIENYFGSTEDMEEVLKYIYKERKNIIYGINVLDDDKKAFELAMKYDAKFIQIDSVAGHLNVEEDKKFHEFMNQMRSQTNAIVLGGVRFKYQPYLSGRSLEEDLTIAMSRCDGIVVTGEGTGMETDLEKIRAFRTLIGNDFPLIVGAGLTAENCCSQLSIANGAIVGSYLKDSYKDTGDVCVDHVKHFMEEVFKLRD
ncbi:BtpA/SgcQ family protein [Bacillus sp. S/N-304-OC-R1]|uniref:BtpA/SgcQ family protein n=1 Tax=Bacillus sp. S/N-304-OC-R1 TaxID=2758034 RepID=UPI001C8DE8FF|nr:BtpA/SgcQ family protein [Bacillus sp. S/N-304-OC-R1]MBY0122916.1 membrane biogenesis protein [Bacillus sp. S/N-304-OC-R1]